MIEPLDPLVDRASHGDAEALGSLLESCGPHLARILAGKIGGNWQSLLDLDDVIQVTFLEAFVRIDQCNAADARSFLGWVTRIAENNLQDAIRELGRAKRCPPGPRLQAGDVDSSCADLFNALTTTTSPSRAAGRNEVRALLEAALSQLPADYQRVVRLYDLEGQSAGEVAGVLGRSEGAVYMLRARAHDRLRELLGARSRYFSDTA